MSLWVRRHGKSLRCSAATMPHFTLWSNQLWLPSAMFKKSKIGSHDPLMTRIGQIFHLFSLVLLGVHLHAIFRVSSFNRSWAGFPLVGVQASLTPENHVGTSENLKYSSRTSRTCHQYHCIVRDHRNSRIYPTSTTASKIRQIWEKVFKIRITDLSKLKQRLRTVWAKLDHVVIAVAIRQWRRQ